MSARVAIAKAAFYGAGHRAVWDAYAVAHSYDEGGHTYPANSADLADVIAWVEGLPETEFAALVAPASERPVPAPVPRNDLAARLTAATEYVGQRIAVMDAAIRQADPSSRTRRESPNGLFNRDQLFVAHVLAEDARE